MLIVIRLIFVLFLLWVSYYLFIGMYPTTTPPSLLDGIYTPPPGYTPPPVYTPTSPPVYTPTSPPVYTPTSPVTSTQLEVENTAVEDRKIAEEAEKRKYEEELRQARDAIKEVEATIKEKRLTKCDDPDEHLHDGKCLSEDNVWAWNKVLKDGKPTYGMYKRVMGEWVRQPGGVINISSADSGNTIGINGPLNLFNLTKTKDREIKYDKNKFKLKQADIDCKGTIRAVSTRDDIYMYKDGKWEQIPGKLKHISGGGLRTYGINSTNNIFKRDRKRNTWVQEFPKARLKYIDVGCDGEAWGIGPLGHVFRWTLLDKGWELTPGILENIKVGKKSIWGANKDGSLYRCTKPCYGNWIKMNTLDKTWRQIG